MIRNPSSRQREYGIDVLRSYSKKKTLTDNKHLRLRIERQDFADHFLVVASPTPYQTANVEIIRWLRRRRIIRHYRADIRPANRQ
jgi:hypothetical protein